MKNIIRKGIRYVAIMLFSLMLFACAKATPDNYDKVQTGMSMQQVVAILGEPTGVESFNFAGLSGTAATWKNGDTTIVVQFFNDKVQIKALNKKLDMPGANNNNSSP